jgi:hypothetical protein
MSNICCCGHLDTDHEHGLLHACKNCACNDFKPSYLAEPPNTKGVMRIMSKNETESVINELMKPIVLELTRLRSESAMAKADVETFAAECCKLTKELEAERAYTAALSPLTKRCADALADEVDALIKTGVIDSRSPAADALLDYREPPSTPRSDRLASLDAEVSEMRSASRDRSAYFAEQQEYVKALEKVWHEVCRWKADYNTRSGGDKFFNLRFPDVDQDLRSAIDAVSEAFRMRQQAAQQRHPVKR